MPKGRPLSYSGGGFIKSMREKHEPHMKLAVRVDSLEKGIPIELATLHKTLSKSFGMQRKTLARVIGLEKRVAESEEQKAGIEEDAVDDIMEDGVEDEIDPVVSGEIERPDEGEVGADKPSGAEPPKGVSTLTDPPKKIKATRKRIKAKRKAKKKKIQAKRKKIKAADLKKGTALGTVVDKGFDSRVHGKDETGEYLSKEERIRRFKEKRTKITGAAFKKGTAVGGAENVAADTTGASDLAVVPPKGTADGLTPPDAEESEGKDKSSNILSKISGPISTIADTVDSIYKTLQDQFKVQEDTQEDARVKGEEKEVKAQEKSLEKGATKKGFGGKIKDTTAKVFKPFMGIIDRIKQFFIAILAGKVLMPMLDWFGDPKNADKVSNLFRFIKDWWPVLVAGLIAFLGPSVTSLVGVVALLMWGVPKIIDAAKFVWELPGRIAGFLTGGGKELDKAGDEAFDNISKDVDTNVKQDPKADQDTKETKGAPKETKELQTGEQKKETPALFGGGKVDKYEDGGKVEDKGGEVKGPKGRDKVPAMLTDGEFVMSKGAVQEYGADTLAGMNAAAGGTNKPDMVKVPHFSGGGQVGTPPEPTKVSSGSDGADGSSGSDGGSGSDGASGSDGSDGSDGKEGKKGNFIQNIWGSAKKLLSPQIRIMTKLIGGVKGMITNIAMNTIKKLTGGIPKKQHLKLHKAHALGIKEHKHAGSGPSAAATSGGKKGLGGLLAGAADAATGGWFDFDGKGGGGADIVKKAKAKIAQMQKGGPNIAPPASNESKVTVIQQGGGGSNATPETGGSKIPSFPVVYPARKTNKQKLLGITV